MDHLNLIDFFPTIDSSQQQNSEITNLHTNQQIMQSIGFKLDVRFQDDHETPVDFH